MARLRPENKRTNTKRLHVRVKHEVYAEIERLADATDRTMAEVVEICVRDARPSALAPKSSDDES